MTVVGDDARVAGRTAGERGSSGTVRSRPTLASASVPLDQRRSSIQAPRAPPERALNLNLTEPAEAGKRSDRIDSLLQLDRRGAARSGRSLRRRVAPRRGRSTSETHFLCDIVRRRLPREGCSASRFRKSGAAAGATTSAMRWRSRRWRGRAPSSRSSSASTPRSWPSRSRQFGSEAQKQLWLPRLASGQSIGAFALSEEHAGSDAANQQTVARLDDRGYVLNGRKVWVANAAAADLVIVFAATQPGMRGRGVSAFLVPMDTPGVERVAAADSLGVRGLGCMDLELRDVRVDADALSARLATGSVSSCGRSTADGSRSPRRRSARATRRWTRRSSTRSHTRRSVSRSATTRRSSGCWRTWPPSSMRRDLLTLKAADAHEREARPTLEASMAKLFASEAAHRAADKAMQILASHGYRRGSVVERLFRDVRAAEIYQGTSEVQRMVIAEQILGGACTGPSDERAQRVRAFRTRTRSQLPRSASRSSAAAGSTCLRRSARSWRPGTASRPGILHEAVAAEQIDGQRCDALGDLGRQDLADRGLGEERQAGVAQARRVVDGEPRGLDVDGGARELVLHGLELRDRLCRTARARGCTRWRDRARPRARPEHLGADADPSFVERLDRDLVALADARRARSPPAPGSPRGSARTCCWRGCRACLPSCRR